MDKIVLHNDTGKPPLSPNKQSRVSTPSEKAARLQYNLAGEPDRINSSMMERKTLNNISPPTVKKLNRPEQITLKPLSIKSQHVSQKKVNSIRNMEDLNDKFQSMTFETKDSKPQLMISPNDIISPKSVSELSSELRPRNNIKIFNNVENHIIIEKGEE